MATAKKTVKPKRGPNEEIAFAQEVVKQWQEYLDKLIERRDQVSTLDGTTPPGGPINPPRIP